VHASRNVRPLRGRRSKPRSADIYPGYCESIPCSLAQGTKDRGGFAPDCPHSHPVRHFGARTRLCSSKGRWVRCKPLQSSRYCPQLRSIGCEAGTVGAGCRWERLAPTGQGNLHTAGRQISPGNVAGVEDLAERRVPTADAPSVAELRDLHAIRAEPPRATIPVNAPAALRRNSRHAHPTTYRALGLEAAVGIKHQDVLAEGAKIVAGIMDGITAGPAPDQGIALSFGRVRIQYDRQDENRGGNGKSRRYGQNSNPRCEAAPTSCA